jgi:uncharacterized protein (DUF1499 family)
LRRWFAKGIAAVAAIAAAVFVEIVMTAPGAEFGFWHRLGLATGTRDDSRPVDFTTLERRSSPNDSLICAADICPRATVDVDSPTFAASPDALRGKLRAVALAEPRTLELYMGAAPFRLRFVQRSALLRYPDIIDALIVPREGGATLALYSRSLVGRRDFGVNRARLERWVAALLK